MNILRRGGRQGEPATDEKNPEEMRQRIEITVEREWVSMLVRQRPGAEAGEAQGLQGDSGAQAEENAPGVPMLPDWED